MDSSIVAAFISALASVIVALIQRRAERKPVKGSRPGSGSFKAPSRNVRVWVATAVSLVVVDLLCVIGIHWDLGGIFMIAVPLVLWALCVMVPIRAGYAVAIALVLVPVLIASEPIGKFFRGVRLDNHFSRGALAVDLGYAFAVAGITWLIALLGSKRMRRQSGPVATDTEEPDGPTETSKLAQSLAELAALHRKGVLSDDEFTRAKDKLIS